jgi:uncharacterized protein
MNRPAGQKELQKMRTHRFSQLFINLVLIFSLALAGLLARTERVQAISADIVISQVYGGGGNSGAPYTHDFVELFNRGATASFPCRVVDPVCQRYWNGNFGQFYQLTE